MPAAGALASICSATAISGVVGGLSWMSYVVVAVVVVVATGVALRAARVPSSLTWLGQVFVLLCLAVTLFTNSGLLVVLPGPSALRDLVNVFGQAGNEIQVGVPPVPADQPILCLIAVAIGLVAISVDVLAVTSRVPAAAGLVLLCVYAVPASLDDQMLPWVSFVLGAGAFTLMLAVDGVERHQAWRGRLGLPAAASAGVAPAAVAVAAAATVVALLVGAGFTMIGTVGRLPGAVGNGAGGTGQLGIKPFTVLQGMLDQKSTTELFDVNGLPPSAPYLRALTLSTYKPGQGFVPDTQMAAGVTANGPLPDAPDEPPGPKTTRVDITPVNWDDVWLPMFGDPKRLQGVSTDYRYDRDSGIVYSEQSRKPGNYTEEADLSEPTAANLRAANPAFADGVDPKYRRLNGVSQRVVQLAGQITANARTEFDKAQAIYDYFHNPASGYTYSTQTAKAVTGDPLVDFLFYGRTGYCEQYSTAMAVMLRAIGLPTRVAIGFTSGFQSGDHRVITSQDAHAWDEVFFPGYGWTTFDPTPLADGRGRTPGYLDATGGATSGGTAGHQNPDRGAAGHSTAPTPTTTGAAPVTSSSAAAPPPSAGPPTWQWWTLGTLIVLAAAATVFARRRREYRAALLAGAAWFLVVFFAGALLSWWVAALLVVLVLAAVPAGLREFRRRERHRAAGGAGPGAADAAWSELLDESWDRGTAIPESDTVRVAAHRMVREHGLDEEGRENLRTLVGEVERSWYGRPGGGGTVATSFDAVRRSLHRNAPLALRARLLPRSVLRPNRSRKRRDDQQD